MKLFLPVLILNLTLAFVLGWFMFGQNKHRLEKEQLLSLQQLDCVDEVTQEVNKFKYVNEDDSAGIIKDLRKSKEGDCEDFAYTKYKMLKSECNVNSNLFFFFQYDGEKVGHAVTVIDRKLVLDNALPYMYSWKELLPNVGKGYFMDVEGGKLRAMSIIRKQGKSEFISPLPINTGIWEVSH
jgi:hypothetical protein